MRVDLLLIEMICFLLNSRGIDNKFRHLQYFLITRNPDFPLITETWPSSEILNSELNGNHLYKIFRSDFKGVGVCWLVKDTVNIIPVSLNSCTTSDQLCLKGSDLKGAFIFRIVLFYTPPNSTSDDNDASILTVMNIIFLIIENSLSS